VIDAKAALADRFAEGVVVEGVARLSPRPDVIQLESRRASFPQPQGDFAFMSAAHVLDSCGEQEEMVTISDSPRTGGYWEHQVWVSADTGGYFASTAYT
jgi:hypothetical protein